jgi:hypothetical protein
LDTLVEAEAVPVAAVYEMVTLPSATPSSVTSWGAVPLSVVVPPVSVAPSVVDGSGEGSPPPVVGQVSEGTQANFTTYEVPG